MSDIFWLLVLLGFAAAAIVLTLVFVALADRSLARGRRRESTPERGSGTGYSGKESDHETQPQARSQDPRDPDGETDRERNA